MSPLYLYSFTGVFLFAIGLYALIFQWHLLKKIIAVNIMCSGVFLIFIATNYKVDVPDPDPVPQALVLTGIVIAISTTALALALACAILCKKKKRRRGSKDSRA